MAEECYALTVGSMPSNLVNFIDGRVQTNHNCPRCDAPDTKLCTINYNHTQPRYFCMSCRGYWTNGGVFRNVPVGGGYRKHKNSYSKTSKINLLSDEDITL
ncbi:hypothetical protein ZOSMA_78G00370 [Zostera marina]|uniref:Dof zinc finger protein n=1 Tax=Zostera marina TaxID=29655 RepID=A0A0K9NNB8_ZOSMR|nr:hypothetical protein ZOSMA_78G00370 [Zostera marina]